MVEQATKTRALVDLYYGKAPKYAYYDGHVRGSASAVMTWPEKASKSSEQTIFLGEISINSSPSNFKAKFSFVASPAGSIPGSSPPTGFKQESTKRSFGERIFNAIVHMHLQRGHRLVRIALQRGFKQRLVLLSWLAAA